VNRGLVIIFIASFTAKADERIEFFEKRIRPVLAQECYECHSTATKQKGGLLLDTRSGWQAGGESGAVIVPGKPEESALMKSIRHAADVEKMPKAGAKLSEEVIADFAKWIAEGAVDPRDQPPSAEEVSKDTSWESIAARRAQWWSFAPISSPKVPAGSTWSKHPVDAFLRDVQSKASLEPAGDAEALTVLRRMHVVLTGLPATSAEMDAFSASWAQNGPEKAIAAKVDDLMQSPHFGERWARHWMDWFRYSEGHGGQGDFEVPGAFEYRDYLIRALNADVPYDQLVREHIAGDLLPQPRVDAKNGIVESRAGLGSLRMVEHGFFPVDSLDELVKFTDNQIDVVTKATLGLTVSCARCHDHKFDPISQRDYHALFGIFASSRPAQLPLNTPDALKARESALQEKREAFSTAMRQQWHEEATPEILLARLRAWSAGREKKNVPPNEKVDPKTLTKAQRLAAAKAKAGPPPVPLTSALHPWNALRDKLKQWSAWRAEVQKQQTEAKEHNEAITTSITDFRQGLPKGWRLAQGTARAVSAGELGLGVTEETAVLSVLPAGLFSGGTTAFEEAAMASPDFIISDAGFALNWAGSGAPWARLVPNNFPMAGSQNGIYGQFAIGTGGDASWQSWDVSFWKEERGYFHVMTERTTSGFHSGKANDDNTPGENEVKASRGSWWHVAEIRQLKNAKDQMQPSAFAAEPLLEGHLPADEASLAAHYAETIRRVMNRWTENRLTDADAAFLTDCLQAGLLRGKVADLRAEAREALAAYRALENELPAVRTAPGVIESDGFDQALYVRGNHRQPADVVPRGIPTLLGGGVFDLKKESGRLQLAQSLITDANPLPARVIANRLWHHVFGAGIVATPDNFGRTGQTPAHPALLDHLATQMREKGWSLKTMLRYLLTTRTFRLDATPSEAAKAKDPLNRLLSHAPVRRLEGEIIRDHLLAACGTLNPQFFGPSEGRTDSVTRRSIYLKVNRTRQGPLLGVFDVPMPTTTRGARDVSTTPAQSIALMNSPMVIKQAEAWARAHTQAKPEEALRELFRRAFTREPGTSELNEFVRYSPKLSETAHLIINLKEFIFIP
jgi:hypothetical protein